MNRLTELPRITDEMLGGLKADDALKRRIREAAARKGAARGGVRRRGVALAFCSMAALALIAVGIVSALPTGTVSPFTQQNNVLQSMPAGDGGANLPQGEARALLDLPDGSLSLSEVSADAPAYRSLFGSGIVAVNGRYYRLMRSPSSVSKKLLGDSLGQVEEQTDTPELSGGIASSVVAVGDTVYAVSGMSGAMVAAPVDGTLRAFQRVSYAGGATVGSEALSDTLRAGSRVKSLELSGVGSATGGTAKSLYNTLVGSARYYGAGSGSGASQSLIVKLTNGLSLQLFVSEDVVSACGSWSCPEFFTQFRDAVER